MPSPGYRVSGKEVEVRGSGSRHHQLCGCCNLQLIQSHVAPSHGPPARVLSPLFFLAKSLLLPKPRGKKKHSKTLWSSSFPFRTAWSSPLLLQNHMVLSWLHQSCLILSLLLQTLVVLSFPPSEPRGPLSIYLLQNLVVFSIYFAKAAWSSPYLLQNCVVSRHISLAMSKLEHPFSFIS